MPSPDDRLVCDGEAGHAGWHQGDGSAWYGGIWNCDEHADTLVGQMAQDATMAAPAYTGRTEWHDWGTWALPRFRPTPPDPPDRWVPPPRWVDPGTDDAVSLSLWETIKDEARTVATTPVLAGITACLAVLTLMLVGAYLTPEPMPPAAVITDCAMQWIDATPDFPLCQDSPDQNAPTAELYARYCVGVNADHVCNRKDQGVPATVIVLPDPHAGTT